MPKSSSGSPKPPTKATGRTRKSASTTKKSATATKKTVPAKRTTKSRRAAVEAPAEAAVEASAAATTPEPSAEPPVLEVAKTTTFLPSSLAAARGGRRAVFIDVENTSSEEALLAALDQLAIDRQAQPTEVVAVGNWRVISHQVARMLAQRGARLHHSAPATGVKDWSDLSIAVHAGMWLGRASPGDVIEIVSADRAFDAVADAAMSLGVVFRRWTYGAVKRAIEEGDADASGRRRRSRRGRRGRRSEPAVPAAPAARSPARVAPPPRARVEPPARVEPSRDEDVGDDDDRHSASHQQIIAAIARLTAKDPERGVNLDLLISALKNEGFSRPPGSPRLVTRLRKMKDVEVSTTGMVRLTGEAAPGRAPAAELEASPSRAGAAESGAARPEPAEKPAASIAGEGETEAAEPPPEKPKRASGRRRSRGGVRRSRAKTAAAEGEAEAPRHAEGEAEPVSRSA